MKIYIQLATTNVYITDYVVRLKAISCKECPAPTCFSEQHDSTHYYIFTAKKKAVKSKGISLTLAVEKGLIGDFHTID